MTECPDFAYPTWLAWIPDWVLCNLPAWLTVMAAIVLAILTAVLALAAWHSASAARQSVEAAGKAVTATERAANAQLVKAFLDEYRSPEWATHLRRLEEFGANYGGTVDRLVYEETSWTASVVTEPGTTEDDARRAVHSFYKSAWQLHEEGLLSDGVMGVIVNSNGYETFHRIATPLSYNLDLGRLRDRALPYEQLQAEDRRLWSWYDRLREKFPPPQN